MLVSGLLAVRGADASRIEFSEASVNRLKTSLRAVAAKQGRLAAPHVVGTENFEGADMAIVQCGQPITKVKGLAGGPARTLRMGIVPGKGYVCPFEEEYVDGKLVVRFEAADYRIEGDGLWFPRRC